MADVGYSTIGAANDNIADNWIWFKVVGTPASNGTLGSISIYAAKTSLDPSICMALYTDSSGAPSALVQANETPITITDGIGVFAWRTQTGFSASLTSGTQYWLAVRISNYDGNHDVNFKQDTNGSLTEGYFKNNAALANFPATVSGATSFANERASFYFTYTPSAGAAPFAGSTTPNPGQQASSARGSVASARTSLFGKDTQFAGPGQFKTYDWPNPPGYPYPTDLRGFLDPSEIWLQGKDQQFRGPSQWTTYDWPNPRIAARSIDALTWTSNGLTIRLPVVVQNPFAMRDWPNPRIAGRLAVGFEQFYVIDDSAPFASALWSLPVYRALFPFGMSPRSLALLAAVGGSAFKAYWARGSNVVITPTRTA